MAKVTITFEDSPNDKVKVVSDPSFETMAKIEISGNGLSSSHGYALTAINAIREASKKEGSLIVGLPKIGS